MINEKHATTSGGLPLEGDSIRGIVASVHDDGNDGFVSVSLRTSVAGVPEGTHITFSLKDWRGDNLPRKGQMVDLGDVSLFEKGWRALSARPIQLKRTENQKGGSR